MKLFFSIIIIALVILTNSGIALDSLPPLPEPFNVRLKWSLPQEKSQLTDTGKISLLFGLHQPGQNSDFGYLGAVQAGIPLFFQNNYFRFAGGFYSDIDYLRFHQYQGQIIVNLPVRESFLVGELAAFRKNRGSNYYQNVNASGSMISPIFYGELNPQFNFHYGQFLRQNRHHILALDLKQDYIFPTLVGDFDLGTHLFIQSKSSLVWSADLADNIVLDNSIFIKPKIAWYFIDNYPGFGIEFGARIGKTISIFQFNYNEPRLINLDSLYDDAGPFMLNDSLKYPKTVWSAKVSGKFENHQFGLKLRRFHDQIYYSQAESLFMPENYNRGSTVLELDIKNVFNLFENHFSFEFNPEGISLIPYISVLAQLTFKWKRFRAILISEIIGKRNYDSNELEPNAPFSAEIGYRYSFFEVKLGLRNIFESTLEIYPNYIDRHRKLYLETSIIKAF